MSDAEFYALDVVLVLAMPVVFLALLIVGIEFGGAARERITELGYPASDLVVLAVVTTFYLVGYHLARPLEESSYVTYEPADVFREGLETVGFLSLSGLAASFGAILTWAVARWFLPRRMLRIGPGKRRQRLSSEDLILVVYGLSIPVLVSFVIFAGLAGIGLTAGFAVLMANIHRDLVYSRRGFNSQHSGRPPGLNRFVLYLRPFRAEKVGEFRLSEEDEPQVEDPPSYVPLDEFISRAFGEVLGPCLAFGNPSDRTPVAGSDRIYLTHRAWQSEFIELARDATAIITSTSMSASLHWELNHIVSQGLHSKLFVITPHLLDSTSGIYSRFHGFLRGYRKPTWEEFRRELAEVRLYVGPNPGRGAVISFSIDRQAVLMGSGLLNPKHISVLIERRTRTTS